MVLASTNKQKLAQHNAGQRVSPSHIALRSTFRPTTPPHDTARLLRHHAFKACNSQGGSGSQLDSLCNWHPYDYLLLFLPQQQIQGSQVEPRSNHQSVNKLTHDFAGLPDCLLVTENHPRIFSSRAGDKYRTVEEVSSAIR